MTGAISARMIRRLSAVAALALVGSTHGDLVRDSLAQDNYVVINLEMIHESRIIPLDGGPPLDPEIKLWMGDSRGH